MKFNKNFSLLLIGQSLANIGDILYTICIINVIFVLTGSAIASSFVPFTITFSMFISSIITPLLFGKVNLKWLLAGSHIGKTMFLIALILTLNGITASNYKMIFLIIGMIAFLDGCATPIRQTLILYYVQPERLLKANGMTETATQIIQAIMWFVGSLLLLILNSQQLILLVGCLFVVSSILLCLLENVNHRTTEHKGKLEQIKEGWKTLYYTPVLRRIAWIEFFETVSGTVWIAAILYVFVNDALNANEKWWGFINGSFCFGLILGSIFCIKYSSYMEKKLGTFIFLGSLASFLVTLSFSLNSHPMTALFMSFMIGLFGQLKNIPQQTVIQTSVSKEQLAAVYSSLGAIGTGVFGVSSLVMGFLAELLGVRSVFVISGMLLAMVTVIAYKNKQAWNHELST